MNVLVNEATKLLHKMIFLTINDFTNQITAILVKKNNEQIQNLPIQFLYVKSDT